MWRLEARIWNSHVLLQTALYAQGSPRRSGFQRIVEKDSISHAYFFEALRNCVTCVFSISCDQANCLQQLRVAVRFLQ